MLLLRGGPAATPFKLQRQLQSVQKLVPKVSSLEAHWIYFAERSGVLESDQIGILRSLLSVETALSQNYKLDEEFIVSPRIGTISPWSSKATDIVEHCGLGVTGRVERGVIYKVPGWSGLSPQDRIVITTELHDRMTQSVLEDITQIEGLFVRHKPTPVRQLESIENLATDLTKLNGELGLALSEDEIEYLVSNYKELDRCPTDVELMMFAQANSEHCRHKIFNASWTIDGKAEESSLFSVIKTTHLNSPQGVLSAYKDNAAVMEGHEGERFYPDADTCYHYSREDIHILMKVETHNHPTAISPFPGASTGSGGEIRDEGATGRGSQPKAGLCGFSVSNLQLPELTEPWETNYGKPDRIVSALEIMIDGPLGAAAFNNEFGRPNLLGYFRTFEQEVSGVVRGYHKPIMIAGGLGNIREDHVEKNSIPPGTPIVVLGGPAMLIGLGGGAASSMASGSSDEHLDFASVQRDNPEMERRCQEVINRCWGLQKNNPIISIHDVGAGGLSNALPEILHDSHRGGHIQLRKVPNAEPGMSPMEIWCNEAQERYVLAIEKDQLPKFEQLCKRERCPYAIVGEATKEQLLLVHDTHFDNTPIDMPMEVLLGKPPKVARETSRPENSNASFDYSNVDINEALRRVLRCPTVASKKFLITIGDRTVTGMVARDQMVGPWQVPVADVAVTTSGYKSITGEAMAMGERTPLALIAGPNSARMAIAEAITNLLAADWETTRDVRLSANWMAAANFGNEDAILFDTVEAAAELCRGLDIAIPVGKDSLSMQTIWQDQNSEKKVVAPVSLIVSAFVPATDVRNTWTPQIRFDQGTSYLVLLDLGCKQNRLGGSCLNQVFNIVDSRIPDLDSAALLRKLISYIMRLRKEINVLSYHDRSDGGLLVTLCEMAFASRCGLKLQLDSLGDDPLASLFSEEVGCVLQVSADQLDQVVLFAKQSGLEDCLHVLGQPQQDESIEFSFGGKAVVKATRTELEQLWSQPSFQLQKLRDNEVCATQEFELISDYSHQGLIADLTFDLNEDVAAPYINKGVQPKVAILREQGVNGHVEMAAAFDRAGFAAVDVHMTDLLTGKHDLADFKMLAACGGFSYGDVLGAGSGWANNIIYNSRLEEQFNVFFSRSDVLALGVCNGCQMMSQLTSIIPGSKLWPKFVRNTSEQFEARLVNVKINTSSSVILKGMENSILPVAVAHGEGRVFSNSFSALEQSDVIAMQYVNSAGEATEKYPLNPNGSPAGVAAVCNDDGRFTIMMPHPERLFRTVQYSWSPADWQEDGPWMRMFRNARMAIG